jgi:hypothetical protein
MCAANRGESDAAGEEVGKPYAGAARVDQGNTDNLPAMVEAAKEYGQY